MALKEKFNNLPLGQSDNFRLKEAEFKKKELQKELDFINSQIMSIKQASPKPLHKLLERIHISDDTAAKTRAMELVHRLHA